MQDNDLAKDQDTLVHDDVLVDEDESDNPNVVPEDD